MPKAVSDETIRRKTIAANIKDKIRRAGLNDKDIYGMGYIKRTRYYDCLRNADETTIGELVYIARCTRSSLLGLLEGIDQ